MRLSEQHVEIGLTTHWDYPLEKQTRRGEKPVQVSSLLGIAVLAETYFTSTFLTVPSLIRMILIPACGLATRWPLGR